MSTRSVNLRVDEDLLAAVDALAGSIQRSRNWVMNEALRTVALGTAMEGPAWTAHSTTGLTPRTATSPSPTPSPTLKAGSSGSSRSASAAKPSPPEQPQPSDPFNPPAQTLGKTGCQKDHVHKLRFGTCVA